MCRLCLVAGEEGLSIPPVRSKYHKSRFLNKEPIIVKPHACVFDSICGQIQDPYEQWGLFQHVLANLPTHGDIRKQLSLPPVITVGIGTESEQFEQALNFLSSHNPARMKTIEQLERNYTKAVFVAKQQRASAISSLQTRQSLEMDMLTSQSNGHSKQDLEALVHQHVSEMDSLVSHWDAEVRTIHQRQLKEYRELVIEVVQSELSSLGLSSLGPSVQKPTAQRIYGRPEIFGLEWQTMTPIAIVSNHSFRARLVRLTQMKGDFIDSLVVPATLSDEDHSMLDPEEQCAMSSRSQQRPVVSALVLGSDLSSFKSNQDIEVVKRIDQDSPADCRWPSLGDQMDHMRANNPSVALTRHSNLGNGVTAIFFLPEQHVSVDTFVCIFQYCENIGIERLFVPSFLAKDLRAPSVDKSEAIETTSLVTVALTRLSNLIHNPSLDEVVIVDHV